MSFLGHELDLAINRQAKKHQALLHVEDVEYAIQLGVNKTAAELAVKRSKFNASTYKQDKELAYWISRGSKLMKELAGPGGSEADFEEIRQMAQSAIKGIVEDYDPQHEHERKTALNPLLPIQYSCRGIATAPKEATEEANADGYVTPNQETVAGQAADGSVAADGSASNAGSDDSD